MQQYENLNKGDYKKSNAFLTKIAPSFQTFLLELPLIYFNTQSYEQLSQDVSAFKTPFIFLPHLDGPTATKSIDLSWLANPMGDNLPYFILPILGVVFSQIRY